MKPTPRFLLSDPSHFIALGFGSGLAPWAPGTFGTLLGWALFPLVRAPLADFGFGLLLVACFLAGIVVFAVASLACAVRPTAVPIAAFSATVFAAAFVSTSTTGLSATFVTAIA